MLRTAVRAAGVCLVLVLWVFEGAPFSRAVAQEPLYPEARERQLGERVLAMGSWGADVFTLQRHLRTLGYDIQADGLYGNQTRAAVSSFQERNGLEVTGRVDKATLDALNAALLKQMETMTYTVKPGDSLWVIARAFDTKMEVIIALNDLPDRPLRVGEVLRVPALLLHEVRPGDTLWEIARTYHTTVDAIARLNGIDPDGILSVGLVLRMPREAFLIP